jgi:hypothetical protein
MLSAFDHASPARKQDMAPMMTTSSNQSRQITADSLLRDLAYVLRLAKSVKNEILAERATTNQSLPLFPTAEMETCAV